PRQRFDSSAGRLSAALFQNLQRHRGQFARVSALLRPRIITAEIERGRDCVADDHARLIRGFRQGLRAAGGSLDSCARLLDSLSYRAILARGFALVRGSDGHLKRRASMITPGEGLTLIFADGEAKTGASLKTEAKAEARPSRNPKGPELPKGPRRAKGQGDLF
ncbi:MAG TPA: exodeoxyribonuclease VII large subunit, partial [Micropepsaceae bacterium]